MTQVMDRPQGRELPPPVPPRVEPPKPAHRAAPLRPRNFGVGDLGSLLATAVSSFAFVWVVFYQLTLLAGAFGFLVCWYFCFLALYWVVTAKRDRTTWPPTESSRSSMTTGAAIVIGLVLFIVG